MPKNQKAKTTPVSLYPHQIAFVSRQADVAGSASRYMQLLIEYDREHDILPKALTLGCLKKVAA